MHPSEDQGRRRATIHNTFSTFYRLFFQFETKFNFWKHFSASFHHFMNNISIVFINSFLARIFIYLFIYDSIERSILICRSLTPDWIGLERGNKLLWKY